MVEYMPEHIKKKMQQDMRNELNRIKMEDSKIIWETDALEQKLKAEASYVAPEERDRIDKMLDEVSKQELDTQLTQEDMEVLSSIFAE